MPDKSGAKIAELASGTPAPPDDPTAAALRGFGPLGIFAILVIVLVGNYPFAPLGAILVLVRVWRSRTPWREIGYARPANWIASVAIGIVFGVAFKFVMKMMVMPLLGPLRSTRRFAT